MHRTICRVRFSEPPPLYAKKRRKHMESIIREVANRIRETRLICEISEEEMAACTGVRMSSD